MPSATLAGWVDKHTLDTTLQMQKNLEQPVTTEDKSSSPKTVENVLQQNTVATSSSHEPTPILDTEDLSGTNVLLSGLLDTLAQLQSDNKNLREKVQLHNKALAEAKKRAPDVIFQGNVDNQILADGTFEEITEAVRKCFVQSKRKNHVLNLNHGLLERTPFENVQHFVDVAKELGRVE